MCGLRSSSDRLTSYWSVVSPDKSAAELDAEQWLVVVPIGRERYLPRLCAVPFQRWMLFVAAFIAQFCNGSLYAWSILNDKIDAALGSGDGRQKAVVTFYIACGFLGLASSVFGPFVERHGPRASLFVGTALFFVGNVVAFVSVEFKCYYSLYAGYGVCAGLGFGINYIAPVSALQKWYPDLRGTAGGVAVCGFGAGAAVWGALYEPLAAAVGIGRVFLVMGTGVSLILVLMACVLRTPPPEYIVRGRDVHGLKVTSALLEKDGQSPPNHLATYNHPSASSNTNSDERVSAVLGDFQIINYVKVFDYHEEELGEAEILYHNKIKNLRLRECIWSIDFGILYLVFLTTVVTGIICMSRVYNMAQDIYGVVNRDASNLVMLLAVFNFLGRLLCPILSDGLIRVATLNPAFGRKLVLAAISVIQCILLLVLPSVVRNPATYSTFQGLMFVLTFTYGGALGTIPSLLTDMYGVYNTGTMHGVILTCWSLSAVVGGLTFTWIFDSYGSAQKVDAYVFNFCWLLYLAIAGTVLLPLVRTNPVDRFFPGYQYSLFGRPIYRRIKHDYE
ncbi:Aste57867_3110 [Aphanomyces stellatus]|uniref:Aste57867_3110 protein n=1 Tax=Aphanomyces stellatus TaxID=120398 RepID=A0A485K916_9STRA|nr:hypothetical protein As57867_003101 [Aphanomyces stellatus]VFT80286.1 Aste57867_3110 [Aphanomyces stellatus]